MNGKSRDAADVLATSMRTKNVLLFIGALGVLAAIAFVAFGGLNQSRDRLSKYLSWKLPESVIVKAEQGSRWEKDPIFYWSLTHPPQALAGLLKKNFRISDKADTENIQKEMAGAFQSSFAAEVSDMVYSAGKNDFDVFVLVKANQTESYVVVFHK